MVRLPGFEPGPLGLRVRYSAVKLETHFKGEGGIEPIRPHRATAFQTVYHANWLPTRFFGQS
jgi:hypothetical protein